MEYGACSRCGVVTNCDVHHMTPKVEGGSNDATNLQRLCPSCHKFVHVERKLLQAIERMTLAKRVRYVEILTRRLAKLRELNSVENIRERTAEGKYGYRTYWAPKEDDYATEIENERYEIRQRLRQQERAGRELEVALRRVYTPKLL